MSKNFSLSDNLYNPTKQYLNTIKNDTTATTTVKYLKFSLSNTLDNTKNNKFIINKDKIRAASCVLPLSDNRSIASSYGTRHRAALGLSELTDAIVIAVSEETGKISVCQNGKLTTDFTDEKLMKYLEENWQQQNEKIIK